MMLKSNAQAIFLLTYNLIEKGQHPLTPREYSKLAVAIKEANLEGPCALLPMSEVELSKNLGLQEHLAYRIKELLSRKGIATLYLDPFFNQGFGLITRTDSDYPAFLKNRLKHNTPPFLTFVGNKQVLNSMSNPLVLSTGDLMNTKKGRLFDENRDLIVIIESTRRLKWLETLKGHKGKLLLLSNAGLSIISSYPIVRNLLQQEQVIAISISNLEARENKKRDPYLHSIAGSFSNSIQSPSNNKPISSKEEQQIDFETFTASDEEITAIQERVRLSTEDTEGLPSDSDIPTPKKTPEAIIKVNSNVIYTIGHSNHPIEYFLELLKLFNIETVVDLRSLPPSKRFSYLNRTNIRKYLKEVGISYVNLGNKLGGRPSDESVLNMSGLIVRDKIEQKAWYREGIEELKRLVNSGKKVALMCAEESPTGCHRGYIVGNTLLDDNYIIKHIRGDKRIEERGLLAEPSAQQEIQF